MRHLQYTPKMLRLMVAFLFSALCLCVGSTYVPFEMPKDFSDNENSAPASYEDDLDYVDCMRERTSHAGEWRKCPIPYGASEADRKYVKCIRAKDFCNSLVDCPNGEDEDPYSCFFFKMSEMKLMEELHITARKYDDKLTQLAENRQIIEEEDGPKLTIKPRKHLHKNSKNKRWVY